MWEYNHDTPAAFAQRVIYPVRMSDRDYVNANMWDGKYPENFDPNIAGNVASRSQQGLAQYSKRNPHWDVDTIAGPDVTDQIGKSVHDAAMAGVQPRPQDRHRPITD